MRPQKTLELENAQAYNNRGIIYANLERHDEALTDYNLAIELNPNYGFAYNNRGLTYANLKRYDEALADYNHAIQLDPNYAQAYLNMGELLANRGAWQEALPYFEKAAQLGHPQGAQLVERAKQELGSTPTK